MHDDPWKAALSRALVISQAGQLVKYAPLERFVNDLWAGFGYRLHTPIGTWYPRRPTLFGEICFHLCQEFAFIIDVLIIFLYLLVQILWRIAPEIQEFPSFGVFSLWCEDREDFGVYPGWQCLGNVTVKPNLTYVAATRSTEGAQTIFLLHGFGNKGPWWQNLCNSSMLIFFESSLALKMGSKNREFRERAVVETFSSFLGAMQAYDTIPERAGSSRWLHSTRPP